MILAISVVRDFLGGWMVATLGLLVLWIWQKRVRYRGPTVLSIEPDETQMRKQKAFIREIERLRKYTLCFLTASVAFGIVTIVAWLYRNVR